MKRLLLAIALLALAPASPLDAQARMVSGAEGALLGRLSNVTSWLGTLSGDLGRTVVVGLIVTPVEGIDLRSGDVVRKFNGKAVVNADALQREYAGVAVGRPVRLGIERGGRTLELTFGKPHPSVAPRLNVQMQPVGSAPKR